MIPLAVPGCVLLPLKGDGSGARAPRFVADLAELFAVDRVGELGAESLDVKLVDAGSDFFIRREGDRDRAVFDLRVLHQRIDHRHDLSAAGFIVGTKQRRAVGRDDVVADQLFEDRILCDGDDLRWILRQHDVAALIILVNDRIDVFAGDGGRSVHVGDEADDRHF